MKFNALRFLPVLSALLLVFGCGKASDEGKIFDQATGKHIASDWGVNHAPSFSVSPELCKTCHGADLKGGQSGVSCDKCHAAPHSHPYITHYTAIITGCTACHGDQYQGGTKAPACNSCHKSLITGLTPLRGECTSCHGKINGPDGAAFPNRSGSHRKHLQLSTVTCAICHLNAGSETSGHGTRSTAVLSFAPEVGGSFNSSAKTCSTVKCHGGLETPVWGAGRLNPKNECTKCHTPSGSAISYTSGKHSKHLSEVGLNCLDCHDITKLYPASGPGHFSDVVSTPFELVPSLTLRDSLNYTGGSCTPTPGNFSINKCHSTENWN